MKPHRVLTLPTPELISAAAMAFDGQAKTAEESMRELFSTYPKNTILTHVLWKVIVLNRIYSTQVFAVEALAKHIVERGMQLDELIGRGASEAVDLFNNVSLGGKPRNLFSFASKYCSWHNQLEYPIFDKRVGDYLWSLQKQTKFSSSFARYEFRTYAEYRDIFIDFRQRFNLGSFDFKTLDKALWVLGEVVPDDQTDDGTPKPEAEVVAALESQGVLSDASFHAEMLANEEANALADQVARGQAREMGFTEEEIARMISKR